MYTVVSFHGQSDESAQELFANGLFATKFSKVWLDLKIYQLTQGMNILFNGMKTATGVNVSGAGMSYKPNVRRELILRIGTVCSQDLSGCASYCL
jgi:hypothetical protein